MQRHSIDQYGGRLLLANSIVINDNDYESQIKERKKRKKKLGKRDFQIINNQKLSSRYTGNEKKINKRFYTP